MDKKILKILLAVFLIFGFCSYGQAATQEPPYIKNLFDQIDKGVNPSKELKDKAGSYLQKQLITEIDPVKRLNILNQLAAIKYEQALPQMGETLSADTRKEYWKPVFIFGKMGDKCTAYLLTRLSDPDRNVRINTIMLLGRWLTATEAAKPFKERYYKESESEIKILLIKGLENCTAKLDDAAEFAKKVISSEKNGEVKKSAKETVSSISKVKKALKEYKKKKVLNRKLFETAYGKLYKSAGKEGNIEDIARTSVLTDEPLLDSLRERILLRNSDECLADYDSVTRIIIFNRWLESKL